MSIDINKSDEGRVLLPVNGDKKCGILSPYPVRNAKEEIIRQQRISGLLRISWSLKNTAVSVVNIRPTRRVNKFS